MQNNSALFRCRGLILCLACVFFWVTLPGLSAPSGQGQGQGGGGGGGGGGGNKRFEIDELYPTYITMGDAFATLEFAIRKSQGNTEISRVRFTLPADYAVHSSSFGPSLLWQVEINPGGAGNHVVEFYVDDNQTSEHIGSQSQVFTIKLKSNTQDNIPSYSQNVSHTLTDIEAFGPGGTSNPLALNPSNDTQNHPWTVHALSAVLFADPVSVDTGNTTTFTIEVQNRTTGSLTVTPETPQKVGGSGNATFTLLSGPDIPSKSLTPGETFQFNYQFTGSNPGVAKYKAGANSGINATSLDATSAEVVVGPLGGWMEVPLEAGDNEDITIQFHVINNSSTNITNLVPGNIQSQKRNGLNNPQFIGGPSPAGPLPILAPGSVATFSWVYRVSGPAGAQYKFRGEASSDQGSTNKDQSEWGTLQIFSTLLEPSTAAIGDSPVTFKFHFHNGGPAFSQLNQVRIEHPDNAFQTHYISGSATGGFGSGWNSTEQPNSVTFTAPSGNELTSSQGMDLYLSYQIPDQSWYPSETTKSFALELTGQVGLNSVVFSRILNLSLTLKRIELEIIPVPPSNSADYWDADGVSSVTLKAKLMNDTTPLVGKNVLFSSLIQTTQANVSIPPQVTPTLATTNAQGFAFASLTAPRYENNSPSSIDISVRATYQNLSHTVSPVSYKPYFLPSMLLQLVELSTNGGSFLPVANVSAMPGDMARFRVKATLIGSLSGNVKTQTTYGTSTLTFTDAENNGTSVFTANLSQDYNNITPYSSTDFLFDTTSIPSGILYGHYTATITLYYTTTGGIPQPNPMVLTTDTLNDVRIGSLNEGIQIITWREKLPDYN